MDQLTDLADDRLINCCVYCGGYADTRDHIPSRAMLERPFPENLPVIGCCASCNHGFSRDEEYFVCFIEASLAGTADPEKIGRDTVAQTLRRSPSIRARIESAKTEIDGRTVFSIEKTRITNVMLKLARGHAAYELSHPCHEAPDYFWCGTFEMMPKQVRPEFNSAHEQKTISEIGSRNVQRMLVTQVRIKATDSGDENVIGFLLNDWVDVQEGFYRYLAIDDVGGLVIRIVVREYLACEVGWRLNQLKNTTR